MDIESKIINQVEYYFSDINLTKDKFLKGQISQNDGWVPIDLLLSFHRLKALTQDAPMVVKSLKHSQSGLIEIDENSNRIRRSPLKPIPENIEEFRKQLVGRTVYIKGFPLDIDIDDIHQFCAKLGSLESISMRRNPDKSFKGSIFAVFKTPQDAKNAIRDRANYKGKKLIMEMEEKYLQRVRDYNRSYKGLKLQRN